MQRLKLLFLLMIFPGINSFAQEIQNPADIPNVIISEMRWDAPNRFYWEITNLEDTAVDLRSYSLFFTRSNSVYTIDPITGYLTWNYWPEPFRFNSTLGPKESYVIMRVEDVPAGEDYPYSTWTSHQDLLLPHADTFLHAKEVSAQVYLDAPELMAFGRDSASGDNQGGIGELMWGAGSWYTYLGLQLCYTPDTMDVDIVIDALLANLDPDKDWGPGVSAVPATAAGVFDPSAEHVIVRKSWVTRPQADWYQSAGTDQADSEWLLLPVNNTQVGDGESSIGIVAREGDRIPFTTVGIHGNYSIDLSSTVVDIDLTANTVSVPWGTKKNEGLISKIDFGPNMGWYYHEDPESFEDSASIICMDGDILEVFAAGDNLSKKELAVKVLVPATDMAKVFEKRQPFYPDEDDPEGITTWGNTRFLVTDSEAIDSITRVPFATRTDTLFKYLEKAPNAAWEIVWVDGVERVDVKDGDKLKVTAEDGSTVKEYYISVMPHEASNNAFLSSITWPDYPADELLDWVTGDTLPGFAPNRFSYIVKLPFGTTSVPALLAVAEDPNAKIEQARAINLKGSIDMRTTTFTVVAESDTVQSVYKVRFEMDRPPEFIQKYIGEPFISELLSRWYYGTSCVEICNPTDSIIDLSNYVFTASDRSNPVEALTRDARAWEFNNRFYNYVPGRVYQALDDPTWRSIGALLVSDPEVNPIVQPGEVFVMASTHHGSGRFPGDARYNPYIMEEAADIIFNDGINPWGLTFDGKYRYPTDLYDRPNVYMWKILNDSVRNGTKPVCLDPEDYELIDVFGWNAINNRKIADRKQGDPSMWEWKFFKKPEYYKPSPVLEEGFGTTADNSEWIVEDVTVTYGGDRTNMVYTVGNHDFVPITEHISMVTSIYLLVSDGFEGTQSIEGVASGATVAEMIDLLMLADEGQVLEVKASDGAVKAAGDVIAAGDQLHVTSANTASTTVYDLTISDLDSDATLVAKDGSGLTVTVSTSTGTVEGMTHDATLASVLDQLIVPDLAEMNVIDANGNMIPQNFRNMNGDLTPVTVAIGAFLEVIAQNGDVILYTVAPDYGEGIFVTSDIYSVDQDINVISDIPEGIGVDGILRNIYGTPNSKVTIIDKAGNIREQGYLAVDDKLEVVSQDGTLSRVYYLTFQNEVNADQNYAPVVEATSQSVTAFVDQAVSVSVTATDDELPFPPKLTYGWSVTVGNADNVNIVSADEATTDVVFSDSGNYELTVVVDDGELQSSASIDIRVDFETSVGLNQIPDMFIYPNPARNSFILNVKNMNNVSGMVTVIDITGKNVIIEEINNEIMTVDVTGLNAGIYLVKVRSGDHTFNSKLQLIK